MIPLVISSKRIASFDGFELTYHVAGSSGPWVVLANGLGAGIAAWRNQIAYLGDQVRILAWDYRRLFASDDGDGVGLAKVSPADLLETHVKDLQTLLIAENIEGGLWMGWSFGAQVLVEMFRSLGPRPDQLVLVNPCYGCRPHDPGGMQRFFPRLVGALEWFPKTIERVVRRTASWPETASWFKRLGFVASTIDDDGLADIAEHLRSVNSSAFLHYLRATTSHRIDGILGGINVPTLVIVGEKDGITTRPNAETLAKQIPYVELFVVRNGTHFVLMEFPELVNLRVEKFLREHPRP